LEVLQQSGYLRREQGRDGRGRLTKTVYTVFEVVPHHFPSASVRATRAVLGSLAPCVAMVQSAHPGQCHNLCCT
jgi:hypothetical protein